MEGCEQNVCVCGGGGQRGSSEGEQHVGGGGGSSDRGAAHHPGGAEDRAWLLYKMTPLYRLAAALPCACHCWYIREQGLRKISPQGVQATAAQLPC
jgi:hypothetical protein